MYSQQLAGQAQVPTSNTGDGPPTFKHNQPGEVVCGLVSRAQHGLDIKGQDKPASVVELTDEQRGPVTFWLSNFQLVSAFVDGGVFGRPVQAGDVIYVRFEGVEPIEGGKTVKNFACAGQAGQGAPPQQQAPQPAPQPQAPPFQPQQAQQFPPQQPAPQPQQWQGPPQQPTQQWQPPQAPTGPVQQGEAPQPQWNTPPGQPF